MTFPFLFAVMYGDVVHGILMTLAALLMVVFEKRLEKAKLGEVVQMMFGGRYLILVMGLFSIYTGLLYNEWLSRPMNLFGTAWYYPYGSDTAVKIPGYTYAFGVDPVRVCAGRSLVRRLTAGCRCGRTR
jgi:V-type H+-transporting ATPase subunit a